MCLFIILVNELYRIKEINMLQRLCFQFSDNLSQNSTITFFLQFFDVVYTVQHQHVIFRVHARLLTCSVNL